MKNSFIASFALLAMVVMLVNCGGKKEKAEVQFPVLNQKQIDSIKTVVKNTPKEPVKANEVGVIETNYGTIIVKFFPNVAPIHTMNFKRLANAGFYNGTTFHRVIPGFMIQGGDILSRDANPNNDGTGGPGYTIPAEFSETPHYRGRLSMARSQDPNSAGSQFFIVQRKKLTREDIKNAEARVGRQFPDSVVTEYLKRGGTPFLDDQYTVFGEVIKGMDVVDKIAAVQTDSHDKPVKPVIMTKVYVTDRKDAPL